MNWKCLVLVLTFIFSTIARRNSGSSSQGKYRLSGDVKPTFYSIKIHPNLDEETFTGQVFMHLTIETSVNSIEFHSSNLNITSLYLDTEEVPNNPCPCNFNFAFEYADFELVRIFRRNKKLIPPGAHVVHIKYHGQFSDTTEGLFKSGVRKNGTTLKYLLATDFQPSRARQVFPCFDEPIFKARYQLDLLVPNSSYVALSNMRVMDKFEVSDGIVYKFEPTPLMSIYLLSFVVTQHTYNEYIDDGIPYRVYCCHAREENSTELLEFASQVIRFYTNYTDFAYPLPKIDLVEYDRIETAATENWGLVTFNTSLLCSDTDFYDVYQKKSVITHELAHFWFGNLVTNAWWDDIWLQESLATFMSIKAEDHILKNNIVDSFANYYLENLFWLELNNISTPVVHFQEDPVKIRENFNDITYIKGAAILRMTEMIIGHEKMKKAIRQYIKKYAFKTATTSDFVAVVSDLAGDVNVREFMETYLYQSRFPIIYVDEKDDKYVLKQKTFVSRLENGIPSSFDYRWTIPVTYVADLNSSTDSTDNNFVWFHKDVEELILPKNNTAWIILNYGQTSYYRVSYSDQLWETFMEHIKEINKNERHFLTLEAYSLFELDERSCDLVLRYIWRLTEVSPFDLEFVYSLYWKLEEIIKKYDEDAALNLKEFFHHIFLKAGKNRIARRLAEGPFYKHEKRTMKVATGQIESCIDWLENESPKYYNNTLEDKTVTE